MGPGTPLLRYLDAALGTAATRQPLPWTSVISDIFCYDMVIALAPTMGTPKEAWCMENVRARSVVQMMGLRHEKRRLVASAVRPR